MDAFVNLGVFWKGCFVFYSVVDALEQILLTKASVRSITMSNYCNGCEKERKKGYRVYATFTLTHTAKGTFTFFFI